MRARQQAMASRNASPRSNVRAARTRSSVRNVRSDRRSRNAAAARNPSSKLSRRAPIAPVLLSIFQGVLMTRSLLFCASLLAFGSVHAADGLSLGAGVDYSSGDYGSDTTTEILSVPFTAKYTSGNWSYKASLPWLRVSGDPNVLPGLGNVVNVNPHGRGRGGVLPPADTQESG